MSDPVKVIDSLYLTLLLVALQQSFSLLGFHAGLVVFMKFLKVGSNDRYGEGENEDPGHGTHAAEEFSQPRGGSDVPVAHGGHGDDHPVDPSRYGGQT